MAHFDELLLLRDSQASGLSFVSYWKQRHWILTHSGCELFEFTPVLFIVAVPVGECPSRVHSHLQTLVGSLIGGKNHEEAALGFLKRVRRNSADAASERAVWAAICSSIDNKISQATQFRLAVLLADS